MGKEILQCQQLTPGGSPGLLFAAVHRVGVLRGSPGFLRPVLPRVGFLHGSPGFLRPLLCVRFLLNARVERTADQCRAAVCLPTFRLCERSVGFDDPFFWPRSWRRRRPKCRATHRCTSSVDCSPLLGSAWSYCSSTFSKTACFSCLSAAGSGSGEAASSKNSSIVCRVPCALRKEAKGNCPLSWTLVFRSSTGGSETSGRNSKPGFSTANLRCSTGASSIPLRGICDLGARLFTSL